ncbi:hypothetical protein CC2G_001516 [Coprinopsis cinerea AmutBmut pab1-1]|nr:hypothetical protein CC2G_001516 [Coprinopsis cinerea AmutBmut pab1-1]
MSAAFQTRIDQELEPLFAPRQTSRYSRNAQLFSLFFLVLVYAALFSTFIIDTTRLLSIISLPSLIQTNVSTPSPARTNSTRALGVANKIYVISLPSRKDRRADMEVLRNKLGLDWTYIKATASNEPIVSSILDWVRIVREGPPTVVTSEDEVTESTPGDMQQRIAFRWPSDIDALARSSLPLDLWDSGVWPEPSNHAARPALDRPDVPLPCATKIFSFPSAARLNGSWDINHLPEHMVLTPSRIACWHSHTKLIHSIANGKSSASEVSIVLEDDVDMEQDIQEQLLHLWKFLPPDWDIVFLGHCWSNEKLHPAISIPTGYKKSILRLLSRSRSLFWSSLHPSNGPKCTHAYALSYRGARRLLLHLRYPPFAYSRAIDQAISWLITSGRLKSYSVVPSLVVQRKIQTSDIGSGTGSKWRDVLTHGFFDDETQ